MLKHRLLRKKPSGFSLVEILVIVLIIGILAAVAGVGIRNYQKSIEADTTASNLSQFIRRTREDAVADRITYRVTLYKNTAVANSTGDRYTLERFVYDPATGTAPTPTPQEFRLPKGWRFGRIDSAPNPRGLAELPYDGSGICRIIFKGDGSMGDGNSTALLSSPTSNVNIPPVNGNLFIYDNEETNSLTKRYKPRSITVLGATGRTSVSRLFDTEWRLPGQVVTSS